MGEPVSHRFELAAMTADVALFRIHEGDLEILLIQRGNPPYQHHWALPGGFVDPGENPRDAAWRELEEETGVRARWLEPVGGFGDAGRDPRGRTVTLTYYTVQHDAQPAAGDDAAAARWWPTAALPALAFDHAQMVEMALTHLRYAAGEPARVPDLVPQPFTFPELARALAALTGAPVDAQALAARLDGHPALIPAGPAQGFAFDRAQLDKTPSRHLPF